MVERDSSSESSRSLLVAWRPKAAAAVLGAHAAAVVDHADRFPARSVDFDLDLAGARVEGVFQ